MFKRLQGKNRSFNKRSYSKIRNITIIPPKNLEFGGLTLLLLPIGGIYKEIPDDAFVLVDFHGEATSEKQAFGYFAKGRANVICGTHTHVQTNDLKMIDTNTLYITDAGMCGAECSVLGMEAGNIIERFITQIPHRFTVETKGNIMFNGFSFTIDDDNIIRDYKLISEIYPEEEM